MPSPSIIAQQEEAHGVLVGRGHYSPDGDKFTWEDFREGGGDRSRPFLYLAGPMSNLPSFNFPAFHEAAGKLRDEGFNIVNPAQLDHEIERCVRENSEGSHKELAAAMEKEGLKAPTWAECLRRDIEIVSDDNCQGIICIQGWEYSEGAQFETYVAYKLRKYIFRYGLDIDGNVALEEIDRRSALDEAGVID